MKKFSIITVCYNSEKTISRTIESVLKQEINDYEYIIIDGKSNDKTLEIIEKYKPFFNGKLRVISESDNGIYDAMNKGLDICEGELVGFINSDDYYGDNVLKKINNIYKKEDEFIYGNTNLIYKFGNKNIVKVGSSVKCLNLNVLKNSMGFVHQSCFVRKEVFDKIGKFNLQFGIGADWDFTIRCFKSGVRIKKYNINISYFSKDGCSCKSHIIERHRIRKSNKLYNFIDMNMIKDIFNPANVIQNFFGQNIFCKCREIYHLRLKEYRNYEKENN